MWIEREQLLPLFQQRKTLMLPMEKPRTPPWRAGSSCHAVVKLEPNWLRVFLRFLL